MTLPRRWQRSRLPDAKQPPNCLYCGRTGRIPENIYSNPFAIGMQVDNMWIRTNEEAASLFGQNLDVIIADLGMTPERYFRPLLDYDWLSCWCPLIDTNSNRVYCHVDVLIERLRMMTTYYQPTSFIEDENENSRL
jgi:hypothetical protein